MNVRENKTIGVFAPSSYVEKDEIERGAERLKTFGYDVHIHPQTYNKRGQMAGNGIQKAAAFHDLWFDENIDAIICAGGGNRCAEMWPHIHWQNLKDNAKPVIGFSDVTLILNALWARCGIPAIHGPHLNTLGRGPEKISDSDIQKLVDLLDGKAVPMPEGAILRDGKMSGPIIGGNLALIQAAMGTGDFPDPTGCILALEDIGDEVNAADRALLHLRRAGILEKISGIIMGEFTDLQDTGRPFGFSLKECILEHTEEYATPIQTNLPFGHGTNHHPFWIGKP